MDQDYAPKVYYLETVHLVSIWLLLVLFVSIVYLWCTYREKLVVSFRPYLVVIGTFFFMTGFLYFWSFEYLLLAFEYGLGISLSFLNPVIAVGFLVANLFIRPWELMPPNLPMQVMPRAIALVALASWLLHLFVKRDIRIAWNNFFVTFLLFLVWLLVSAVFAFNNEESLEYIFKALFPVVVLVFLVLNCVTTRLDIRFLLNVTHLSVIGLVVNAIYVSLTYPSIMRTPGRLEGIGLWSNSNDLAALIVLVLPIIAYCYFIKSRKAGSWLTGLAFATPLFIGLMMSQSRGAILSLGVCGIFYVAICMRGTFKRFMAFGVIIIVPVILFLTIDRDAGELDTSSSSRLNYMVTGVKMLKHHMVFGVGPGNYPLFYESYTSLFHEEGKRTAHSSWVLILSETGPIGFMLFMSLFIIAFKKAWLLRTTNPEFILALVSYCAAISFLSHSYLLAPYLLLALIVAGHRVYKPVLKQELYVHDKPHSIQVRNVCVAGV